MRKYEHEMVNFLAQPQNVEFAFEIYSLFKDVRDKLITDFWKSLCETLQKRLSDGGYEQDWSLDIPSDREKWPNHKDGITIKERNAQQRNPDLYISFRIGQSWEDRNEDDIDVWYGLSWSPVWQGRNRRLGWTP